MVSKDKEYSLKKVVRLLRSSSSYVIYGRWTYPVKFYLCPYRARNCWVIL